MRPNITLFIMLGFLLASYANGNSVCRLNCANDHSVRVHRCDVTKNACIADAKRSAKLAGAKAKALCELITIPIPKSLRKVCNAVGLEKETSERNKLTRKCNSKHNSCVSSSSSKKRRCNDSCSSNNARARCCDIPSPNLCRSAGKIWSSSRNCCLH